MANRRTVVLNGDLGSGKTTVSKLLAQRLGVRRISVGDLYRSMAAQRGMTALQLNLHAELDDKIDHYVDQLQADIATSGEQLVVDSRLAWHFFTDAVKVHMLADPTVAARRAMARPANDVERYATVEEARQRLASRSDSERARFLTRYGVDKSDLRNYDLVLDSTTASPAEIVERIADHVDTAGLCAPNPVCHLDPRRIRRTTAAGVPDAPPLVMPEPPSFVAIAGWERISEAARSGAPLVAVALADRTDSSR
ncbi:MAG: AAA family ATPase [Hamadaea sp.]|nr:AAA family ATPase [Hamadaea sp.]NUT04536.1 AAA family ATPase [Hamadaea sp.]